MLIPKVPFQQIPEGTSADYIIIGAGGTGGFVIRDFARIFAQKRKFERLTNRIKGDTLTVVDADDVENKNLIRQNFTKRDINKNKAVVQASRYGAAYGEDFTAYNGFVEDEDTLIDIIKTVNDSKFQNPEKLNDTNPRALVVIDFVDNTATRHVIFQTLKRLDTFQKQHDLGANKSYQSLVYLSAGNEERTGQVSLSMTNVSRDAYTDLNTALNQDGLSFDINASTPSVIEFFSESMRPKDKLPSELSCAEHAESAEQNISANLTSASVSFNFLNKLLHHEKIFALLVMFNSESLTQTTYKLSEKGLLDLFKISGTLSPYVLDYFTEDWLREKLDLSDEELTTLSDNLAELKLESQNRSKTHPEIVV